MQTTTENHQTQAFNPTLPQNENAETPCTMSDQVLGSVGAKLVGTARALRQKSAQVPGGSGVGIPFMLAVEDAGFFLQGRPTEELLYETGRIIRRRPLPFLLIGAALGFLLARGKRR